MPRTNLDQPFSFLVIVEYQQSPAFLPFFTVVSRPDQRITLKSKKEGHHGSASHERSAIRRNPRRAHRLRGRVRQRKYVRNGRHLGRTPLQRKSRRRKTIPRRPQASLHPPTPSPRRSHLPRMNGV